MYLSIENLIELFFDETLEDLLIEFDEMSFYPATFMPNSEECAFEWKCKLIYALRQFCQKILDMDYFRDIEFKRERVIEEGTYEKKKDIQSTAEG